MRVFISHSSKDKPAVEALATELRARGIDAWLDKWEIASGSDIVASINAGLEGAGTGIIVFSEHSQESRWVEAEVSYWTHARIEEGKVLIPVVLGENYFIPPLLRPLLRRKIDEIDAIADAVLHRTAKPALARPSEQGNLERVLVTLNRTESAGIRAELLIGAQSYGKIDLSALPKNLAAAHAVFVRGFRYGLHRDHSAAERQAQESQMAQLGGELGALCFPDNSGLALANLIDGAPVGTTVEVIWEADDPELLGLPFEAACLPDGRILSLQPNVVMMRRPHGLGAVQSAALAGPLKILVAVAAPDEGPSSSAPLDHERETQNILDAVEPGRFNDNCEVRILEVGHPELIGKAIEADAYHVLHLSCHGLPGALELEDEEGQARITTSADLLEPIRRAGRPLPLVFLSTCHGGVSAGQTASLAEALLRGGVPAVVAMQAPVSDSYATALAKSFYEYLASRENFLPSRALADARKEQERERLKSARLGAAATKTPPEYATAALYVAGEERPLADFARDQQPLRKRPVFDIAGPVPQLRIDDLIGRRRELREALRSLRDPARQHAGVVLTGIGGVGKSAVAGRVMCRLAEDNWLIVTPEPGRLDLRSIAFALGAALRESNHDRERKRGEDLLRPELDESLRLDAIAKTLAEDRVLLVLDDFEQNLTIGGGDFLDPDVAELLLQLAQSARVGRLLVTCRYPAPEVDPWLRRIAIGPLSPAETRKLRLRLPALAASDIGDDLLLRLIGGHPRMLELLDAILRGGAGRLPTVTKKLHQLARDQGVDLTTAPTDAASGIEAALALGARDVLLSELLAIVRDAGIEEELLQTAVSNLPVTPQGLARMLADDGAGDLLTVEAAAGKLESISLLHRFPDGAVFVHRWTAQGLGDLSDTASQNARNIRAGRYRMWRVEHETHDINDGIEAMRNFLAGQDFDAAVTVGVELIVAFRYFRQSRAITVLAAEILETLPENHGGYANVADEEAKAHIVLGETDRALRRYQQLLSRHETLVLANPDRPDYQRALSVSYDKMGGLYRTLGKGDEARAAFLKSLAIAERLAQAEPDRADYQRDLSISYNNMGDIYRALGQVDEARAVFLKSLAIRERLAQAEPDRADYQRDLAVSYERIGDLYSALEKSDEARAAFLKSLAIAERLAQAEPDSADNQRNLWVSYNKMGDIYLTVGRREEAETAYLKALAIAERLAQAEPDRADYQRDLSVSYSLMGNLYRTLGRGDEARSAFLKSLAIAERLAQAEPDRADYQRDLVVSYVKISEYVPAEARKHLTRALDIAVGMRDQGRLEPVDAWMPEDLAGRLEKLSE